MPHFPQIENECKRTFSFWEAYEEKLGLDAHHGLVSFLKSFEYSTTRLFYRFRYFMGEVPTSLLILKCSTWKSGVYYAYA